MPVVVSASSRVGLGAGDGVWSVNGAGGEGYLL